MSVCASTCQCMSARVSVSKYVLLRVSTFQYLFICSFINLKMHSYNNKKPEQRRGKWGEKLAHYRVSGQVLFFSRCVLGQPIRYDILI